MNVTIRLVGCFFGPRVLNHAHAVALWQVLLVSAVAMGALRAALEALRVPGDR